MDSIFATLLGFNELNILGEVIKILKIDRKFEIGKHLDNACDDPRTENNKSKVLIGMTLNMREFITGFRMATSTGVGIVFTRKGEDSSRVSNRPSRKPKRVEGGSLIINSVGGLEAMNVSNDTKVGNGRHLIDDLDIDSAVIKLIADDCGKSLKNSGVFTIPTMDMKLPLGMLFRTPGDSDSNPFKNRTLSFVGTSHSAHRLTANIESAEIRHGCGIVESNFGEHANMLTKFKTMAGGSGSII